MSLVCLLLASSEAESGFICGEKLKVEGYFALIGKGEATHVLDNLLFTYLFALDASECFTVDVFT